MGVRYSIEDNPFYPLPPDYCELTNEGRKLARLNLIKTRETVLDEQISAQFFSSYYLNHDESNWYVDYVPSPAAHADWVAACHQNDRVAIAASRGFSKSTKFLEFMMRDTLTIPQFSGLLVLSSHSKVEKAITKMQREFESNTRILEDFGELKPKRGSGLIYNKSCAQFLNGCSIDGASVTARSLRGERPKRVLVDDPEYDPKEGTNIDRMIADMETLLFQVLLPMLRRGSSLHWIGTPIRRKLFLWKIIAGDNPDPRLDPDRWFREMYPLLDENGRSTWPEEYPEEEIERRRIESGSTFGAEYMCNPSSGEYTPLELNERLNGYTFDSSDVHPRESENPLAITSEVSYVDCKIGQDGVVTKTDTKKPWNEVVGDMLRFVTVDPIRSPGPQSDWCVIQVFGIDKNNQLWSLDIWGGKVRYSILADRMWKMASKWKCRVIGVECIGMDIEMKYQAQGGIDGFVLQNGWRPKFVFLTYPPGLEKEDRIMALETRISHGLFKLPYKYRNEKLHYGPLFHQIEFFTPDGGNLEHDDHVDTAAMAQWMLRARSNLGQSLAEVDNDPVDYVKKGQMVVDGMPVSLLVDWQSPQAGRMMDALEKSKRYQIDTSGRDPGGWSNMSL